MLDAVVMVGRDDLVHNRLVALLTFDQLVRTFPLLEMLGQFKFGEESLIIALVRTLQETCTHLGHVVAVLGVAHFLQGLQGLTLDVFIFLDAAASGAFKLVVFKLVPQVVVEAGSLFKERLACRTCHFAFSFPPVNTLCAVPLLAL